MDKPYKIYFERSGGFTGLPLSVEVLSDKLAKTDRARLDTLMEKSNVLNSKPEQHGGRVMPDQFNYLIRIKSSSVEKEFNFSDNTIPADALPLVNYLVQLARWQKSQ